MIHVGLLRYAGARYLWWALALTLLSIGLYLSQRGGLQPPNGGTWQGYVLGTAGALLIVWLAMLGIRKRSYSSSSGTVQGWTSAHLYLGSALLIIATLHSAGQLGFNIHSLAYILMCIVIVSGMYGVYAYVNYPQAVSANRAGSTRAELFAELFDLDKRARELGAKSPDEINVAVKSAVERTVIGGGLLAQLTGRDDSSFVQSDPVGSTNTVRNRDQQSAIDFIAERVPKASKVAEAQLIQELLAVLCRRQAILRRISRDIRLRGWTRIWLLVHIPLTAALIVALAIHILTTFIYW